MVSIKIVISEIDYGRSLAKLFPQGMEKCRKTENPNLAVRFLLKMGDASMTAALGILDRMSASAKGELLCGLVNLYCQELQSALNTFLQKDEVGKNIRIGDFYMVQDTQKNPILIGSNIKIDYSGLTKNDTIKQKIGNFAGRAIKKTMFGGSDVIQKVVEDTAGSVAEIAVGVAPGVAEKKVLAIIGRQENKDRLLRMAEQVLAGKGLFVRLADFIPEQEPFVELQDEVIVKDVNQRKFELSPALEDELLDAVAGYLKSGEGR